MFVRMALACCIAVIVCGCTRSKIAGVVGEGITLRTEPSSGRFVVEFPAVRDGQEATFVFEVESDRLVEELQFALVCAVDPRWVEGCEIRVELRAESGHLVFLAAGAVSSDWGDLLIMNEHMYWHPNAARFALCPDRRYRLNIVVTGLGDCRPRILGGGNVPLFVSSLIPRALPV